MKKIALPLGTLFIVLISQGCGNVRSQKITTSNVNEVAKHVANSSLSEKDKQLFVGYLMRSTLGSAFSQSAPSYEGKTVGQAIEEQRQWIATQDAEEHKAKQKAADEEAQRQALRHELSLSVLSLTPVSHGFMDGVSLECFYRNATGKDIRAFEGTIEFKDVLGNNLGADPFKVLTPIKSGDSRNVNESFPYMIAPQLRDQKLSDLAIVWTPTKIVFADGTTYGE
jgi:hypothetical protein